MKAKPPSKPKTHLHLHQEEPQNPSEFSFAIPKIAVSQICQSVGYKATQLSALNALTMVATKYLEAIAKSASSLANTSNCTQSNLLDLTLALHHLVTLHTSTLFSISFSRGGIIRDLADFVSFNDEIPFAKPIPRLQITSIPSWTSSFSSSSSSSHVPKWLPKFLDSVISCSVNERKCGERLWEDSVLGGRGFGLVDLLLGL
ncbi:transcription initiation factor TFIID subunit 8-like [Quercus lobata]|uniref:transcription initiation factor TFIID subunit 8-like n=1 Tax=Quercus lobata TaxID=97700 RepID=UPI001245D18C|nr:transcription initiation factor TFIID subunit 8-like [Quercus lobata]